MRRRVALALMGLGAYIQDFAAWLAPPKDPVVSAVTMRPSEQALRKLEERG